MVPPDAFRAALLAIPPAERDDWLDRVLGLDSIPADGPELPRGCVPYLPCSVEALLQVVDEGGIRGSDVFVDLGSGAGRAGAFVHLLTGATVIGIEIQAGLVRAARELAVRANLSRFSVIEGDAVSLAGSVPTGTFFFLYCPFSGDRLERALDGLHALARTRPIRVGAVDVPLPPRPWLALTSPPCAGVEIYRSVLDD